MLAEVLASLQPRDGETYVDGTFGAGGYTAAILDAADCRVVALDRDPTAILGGYDLVSASKGRLTLVEERFSQLAEALDGVGLEAVDGLVLDIGVSSMQLDEPERGFSFQQDGPLDMRMSAAGPSAAGVVNTADEKDLADILFHLGEERQERRAARIAPEKAGGDAQVLHRGEIFIHIRSLDHGAYFRKNFRTMTG